MTKDVWKQNGSEEAREGRGQQPAQRPAPGKVTRTSKLEAGRPGPVQRKAPAPGATGSAAGVKSRWELTMDPGMDAAFRGAAAFGEVPGAPAPARQGGSSEISAKALPKTGADEDKKVEAEGGGGEVTTGAAAGPASGGVEGAPGGAPLQVEGAGAVAGPTVAGPTGAETLAGGESQETAKADTMPAGPDYSPKAITPNFILDKKVAARSNTKPSTQSASDPTFVGETAVDKAGNVWRYQLESVESKGKIRIVYYSEDHYPAPTPTDDSGALTNVKSGNWKDIVKDLDANKAGIFDFWSAYRAEDVHETYHWEVEWQGEIKKELVKAEAEIAKLSLGFDKAATAAAANAILAPQAAKIFQDAMKRARAAYDALGDSPGDPPYRAQVPVVEALIKRVKDHAASNGWS